MSMSHDIKAGATPARPSIKDELAALKKRVEELERRPVYVPVYVPQAPIQFPTQPWPGNPPWIVTCQTPGGTGGTIAMR